MEICHEPIVSFTQVGFKYEDQAVLSHMDFTVYERDFFGIIGMNGAGKTTLLRLMVGLLRPTSGKIKLFHTPIAQFKDWRKIGYVAQKNMFNPFFPATVMEVVQSGLYDRQRMFRKLKPAEKEQCYDALCAMRVEDLAHKRMGQLSGGQQQRVFLARAMVNKPDLLILDEPTVGIDIETRRDFSQLLQHLHEHHRMTFIVVTHDMDLIRLSLGCQPMGACGKLRFYVKHSHNVSCVQSGLAHGVHVHS